MAGKARTDVTWRRLTVILFGALFLASCLIPDDYTIEISTVSPTEVQWKFDGRWQFFFAGFDPRKDIIPPEDIEKITLELGKLPGSLSVSHVDKNVWRQSIFWKMNLFDGSGTPRTVNLPSGKAADPMEVWIVQIIPESSNSLIVQTPSVAPAEMAEFTAMGYTSNGKVVIRTSGNVEQLEGPAISKGWLTNTYSVSLRMLQGQHIKIRIKW